GVPVVHVDLVALGPAEPAKRRQDRGDPECACQEAPAAGPRRQWNPMATVHADLHACPSFERVASLEARWRSIMRMGRGLSTKPLRPAAAARPEEWWQTSGLVLMRPTEASAAVDT